MSPFDINSVVFHFDDFNYGRRSQAYFFQQLQLSLLFFITYNKMKNIYHTVGTVPTFNSKIVEIISFSVRRLLSITFHINIQSFSQKLQNQMLYFTLSRTIKFSQPAPWHFFSYRFMMVVRKNVLEYIITLVVVKNKVRLKKCLKRFQT